MRFTRSDTELAKRCSFGGGECGADGPPSSAVAATGDEWANRFIDGRKENVGLRPSGGAARAGLERLLFESSEENVDFRPWAFRSWCENSCVVSGI